jgi:hypothetical protein
VGLAHIQLTADGTLYFSVLDLAKWDEALYGASLLKQYSLDRIWTVFPLNDGEPQSGKLRLRLGNL